MSAFTQGSDHLPRQKVISSLRSLAASIQAEFASKTTDAVAAALVALADGVRDRRKLRLSSVDEALSHARTAEQERARIVAGIRERTRTMGSSAKEARHWLLDTADMIEAGMAWWSEEPFASAEDGS